MVAGGNSFMSERASNVFYHISPQIWEKKKKARHTPKNLWGLLCIMDEAEAASMGLVICYIICIIGWLLFSRKCGGIQYGLGKVATAQKKFWAIFIFKKTLETMSNFWPICAGRADWLVFSKVSTVFLKYKNGSNVFYELLRSILTFTELPYILEKR